MQEKRGVIEPGRTPPESEEKQASENLEEHLMGRLSKEAQEACEKGGACECKGRTIGNIESLKKADFS